MFHRIVRPKEKERERGTAGWWNSQDTPNIHPSSLPSYMGIVQGAPKQLQ